MFCFHLIEGIWTLLCSQTGYSHAKIFSLDFLDKEEGNFRHGSTKLEVGQTSSRLLQLSIISCRKEHDPGQTQTRKQECGILCVQSKHKVTEYINRNCRLIIRTNKTKQRGDANVFMSQIQISNRLIHLINPCAIDYFKRTVFLFFTDYVIFVKCVIWLGGQEFLLCSRAQPIRQNFVYNFFGNCWLQKPNQVLKLQSDTVFHERYRSVRVAQWYQSIPRWLIAEKVC